MSKDAGQQKKLIKIEGDKAVLDKLCANIVDFEFFFNIVEP